MGSREKWDSREKISRDKWDSREKWDSRVKYRRDKFSREKLSRE